MFALIKGAGDDVPAGEAVFFRSFFAIFPVLAVLAIRGELAGAFRTVRAVSHVMRGLVGVTSMILGFFALTRLPLPETITLQYAQPFSWSCSARCSWAKSSGCTDGRPSRSVWLASSSSLAEPDAPLRRRADGPRSALGAIAALASAGFSATAMLLVRRLVHTERTPTIVLWFSMTATVFGLCTLPFGWVMPDAGQAALLVTAGVIGGFGQIMLTESYRQAPMSTIAPFEYTSILFGAVIGYAVFGDVPGPYMVVGGLIVVGAGLFIIWREQRLGLERAAARRVAPPQ